ncbi:MAG: thioredoxin family protein [Rubrivivax sp.]
MKTSPTTTTTTTTTAIAAVLGAAALWSLPPPATALAVVGQPAPAFTATDVDGRRVSLADFKGRHILLEWVNPGCPYVRKHYSARNMQATQQSAVGTGGVAWLAANSTHPDHVDHLSPPQMARWMQQQGGAPTATLMDEDGSVGRAYGARTTPHLFVVDPRGTLVYAGAIDDRPSANPADIAGATNHVKTALAQSLAGQPVAPATTRAYGCSVKYGGG